MYPFLDMAKEKQLLDLPNEILRDKIFSCIPKEELFWTVGLVCKRLLSITFDITKTIQISEKSVRPFLGFKTIKISDFWPSFGSYRLCVLEHTEENKIIDKIKGVFLLPDITKYITWIDIRNHAYEYLDVFSPPYYYSHDYEDFVSYDYDPHEYAPSCPHDDDFMIFNDNPLMKLPPFTVKLHSQTIGVSVDLDYYQELTSRSYQNGTIHAKDTVYAISEMWRLLSKQCLGLECVFLQSLDWRFYSCRCYIYSCSTLSYSNYNDDGEDLDALEICDLKEESLILHSRRLD